MRQCNSTEAVVLSKDGTQELKREENEKRKARGTEKQELMQSKKRNAENLKYSQLLRIPEASV